MFRAIGLLLIVANAAAVASAQKPKAKPETTEQAIRAVIAKHFRVAAKDIDRKTPLTSAPEGFAGG
jgi:hypothetical protein